MTNFYPELLILGKIGLDTYSDGNLLECNSVRLSAGSDGQVSTSGLIENPDVIWFRSRFLKVLLDHLVPFC